MGVEALDSRFLRYLRHASENHAGLQAALCRTRHVLINLSNECTLPLQPCECCSYGNTHKKEQEQGICMVGTMLRLPKPSCSHIGSAPLFSSKRQGCLHCKGERVVPFKKHRAALWLKPYCPRKK